jgi:DNA-binding NarL/FixJ family response regulator
MRMLIADHNQAIRASVRATLSQCADFAFEEAASEADVLEKVRSRDYQLVLVEPLLGLGREQTFIKRIRRATRRSNVLVLTELGELKFGVKAFQCGATGYLTKGCPAEMLLDAAQRVAAGKVYISPTLAEEVALTISQSSVQARHEVLTPREYQIFAMLVCEWNLSNIALTLRVSQKTVGAYRAAICAKLLCKNQASLTQYAIAQGLHDKCREESELM